MTTVTDARTGNDTDLAHVLASLMEQKRTGTLKLNGDDGRVKYIYFKRGTVELLKEVVQMTGSGWTRRCSSGAS